MTDEAITSKIDYAAHKAIQEQTEQYLDNGGGIDQYDDRGIYSCTISIDYPDGIVDNDKLARSLERVERIRAKQAKVLKQLFSYYKDNGEHDEQQS